MEQKVEMKDDYTKVKITNPTNPSTPTTETPTTGDDRNQTIWRLLLGLVYVGRSKEKADLRRERWGNGWKRERFACLQIEISGERVVLSDFDSWSIILLHGLLSDSEEEDTRLENEYNSLPKEERKAYRDRNRKRAFELSYVDNDWVHRGDSVQATFWELRKEDIQKVWFFTAATSKPDDLKEIDDHDG